MILFGLQLIASMYISINYGRKIPLTKKMLQFVKLMTLDISFKNLFVIKQIKQI